MDGPAPVRAIKKKPRKKAVRGPLRRCEFAECRHAADSATNRFCCGHRGGKPNLCLHEGCRKLQYSKSSPMGYCYEHMPNKDDYLLAQRERSRSDDDLALREETTRWKRNRQLRSMVIDVLNKEQDGRCAGLRTCEMVKDGLASSMCPWGVRRVPLAAQEVDHIVPYSISFNDARSNLQMLCACCHAMKTAAERGAASIGRSTE